MNDITELCALINGQLTRSGEAAATLDADEQLLELGLLDSLAIMQIVSELDKQHGITLPDTEIVAANFRSPRALWNLVQSLGAGAAR